MDVRTDLALERSETFGENLPEGVHCMTQDGENMHITRITVENENGARALGKPIGTYITVEVPPFKRNAQFADAMIGCIADELRTLLPPEGTVLVAGLGNDEITPDALGPKFSSLVFATRHIGKELADIAQGGCAEYPVGGGVSVNVPVASSTFHASPGTIQQSSTRHGIELRLKSGWWAMMLLMNTCAPSVHASESGAWRTAVCGSKIGVRRASS